MNEEFKAIAKDMERQNRLWHPNDQPWTVDVANGVFDRVMHKASIDLSPEEYELFLRHIFDTKLPNAT